MVPDKPLSLHAQAVSCFNKGKLAKGLQFGRAFQLGRIEGNFLLAGWCSSIRMEDKASLRPMIVEHQHLFGKGVLKSLGTDKGYYSEANRRYLRWLEGLEEFCLPQPGLDSEHQSPNATAIQARLLDRRSGIEPLIGHAKQGGQLGKSRMKKETRPLWLPAMLAWGASISVSSFDTCWAKRSKQWRSTNRGLHPIILNQAPNLLSLEGAERV